MSFKQLHAVLADSVLTVPTESALPDNPSPFTGNIRLVEDTGELFAYFGGQWQPISGASIKGPGVTTPGSIVIWDSVDGSEVTGSVVTIDVDGTVKGAKISATDNTVSNIVDTNIASNAAIALSKLATLTASRATETNASGVVTASAVTSTELGYLSGTTSGVQGQIDNKQPLDADLTALAGLATTGMIARTGAGTVAAREISVGSAKITVSNGSGVSGNPTIDLGTVSSDDITEGTTNKFFTDQRVQDYIDTIANLPDGVAVIDPSGKIPVTLLPPFLTIKGAWSAATNTPALTNGTGTEGDVWVCSAGGTVNFGAGNVTFATGDWAIYSASGQWFRSENSTSVASVNGFTGAVILDTDDIAEGSSNKYYTDALARAALSTSDSSTVGFTYNPTSGILSADVLPLPNSLTTATASNTPSTIVARDSSGNFSAGTITANLVSTSGTLTTMDIDGGTASNTSRITIPQASKATLDGLTRKAGTMVYATDLGKYFLDNGITLVAVGSGSGQGELNLLSNPSGADGTSGWTVSGAGSPTVTRVTSSAPLDPVIPTALRFDGGSAGAYIESTFTVPDALANTKLKLEWYQEPEVGAVSGEWKVEVYNGATKLSLTTDSSGDSLIPAFTGKYTTTFDTGAAGTGYKVRYVRVTGSNHLDVTNVVIGPGIGATGAVVEQTVDVTVTGTWTTNSTYAAKETRIGTWARYDMVVTLTGAPNANALGFNLPAGRTIDLAALPSTHAYAGAILPSSAGSVQDAGTGQYFVEVAYNTTTSVVARYFNTSTGRQQNVDSASPMTFATGDKVQVSFMVPIAEWAGSGTVNLGQNDVEYASVGGTWDANSTTTVYGQQGSLMGGALTGLRNKTLTWATPVQPSDRIQIWASRDQISWFPITGTRLGAGLDPVTNTVSSAGSNISGVTWTNGASANQTVFSFAQYMSAANDDSPTIDWPSSQAYWVATKSRAGQAVGFSNATTTSSGLVSTQAQSFAGVKTFEDGAAIKGQATTVAAGYIGETVISNVAPTTASASLTTGNLTSISLSPGRWMISATVYREPAASNSLISLTAGVSTTSATIGGNPGVNYARHSGNTTDRLTVASVTVPVQPTTVPAGPNVPYYLVYSHEYAGAAGNVSGSIVAWRIG